MLQDVFYEKFIKAMVFIGQIVIIRLGSYRLWIKGKGYWTSVFYYNIKIYDAFFN